MDAAFLNFFRVLEKESYSVILKVSVAVYLPHVYRRFEYATCERGNVLLLNEKVAE